MFGAHFPVHLVPSSGWDPPSTLSCLSVLSCLTLSVPSAKTARAGRRTWVSFGAWLRFSPLQAGLCDLGCRAFSGGSSHLFISPIVKSVGRGTTEVGDFSLQTGCSAGGSAPTFAFPCCFPAACLQIRISSWNRIVASWDQPRERGAVPGGEL